MGSFNTLPVASFSLVQELYETAGNQAYRPFPYAADFRVHSFKFFKVVLDILMKPDQQPANPTRVITFVQLKGALQNYVTTYKSTCVVGVIGGLVLTGIAGGLAHSMYEGDQNKPVAKRDRLLYLFPLMVAALGLYVCYEGIRQYRFTNVTLVPLVNSMKQASGTTEAVLAVSANVLQKLVSLERCGSVLGSLITRVIGAQGGVGCFFSPRDYFPA